MPVACPFFVEQHGGVALAGAGADEEVGRECLNLAFQLNKVAYARPATLVGTGGGGYASAYPPGTLSRNARLRALVECLG